MKDPRIFIQTIISLASASLGLVAALAWNDAIKATIKTVLGTGESLSALYTYAILATIIAVTVVSALGWLASKMGGEAVIQREVDG